MANHRRVSSTNKHQVKINHERHRDENQVPTPVLSNPINSPHSRGNDRTVITDRSNRTPVTSQNRNLVTRFDLSPETDNSFDVDQSLNQSMKTSSKTPSIAHESINTRNDNISTLPVISMSTVSVRSSTFSENSQPSTSGTVLSDHPTLYTNASTVGIPPASIMDRRERLHHPVSLNNYHLTGHNNSSHTINTSTSPTSAIPNEYGTDISSLKS